MDINEKLEKIGNAWEHYKDVNDERLKQIEKKGSADGILLEELSKINDTLDEQKSKIEKLEVTMSRPAFEGKTTIQENVEYKNALNNYIKKGIDSPLVNLEKKLDLTSTDTSSAYGGYLLSPNMQQIIADELQNSCFMRKICSIQKIGSSALEIIDDTNFTANWLDETDARPDTDVAVISKTIIKAHELVAQPKVTQKMLDDAFINIEEYVAYKIADQFAEKEEEAFINGDGINKPKGILENIDDVTTSAIPDGFEAKDIIELFYSLPKKYANGASFVMSRDAVAKVRMLKDDTSGAYLWQPAVLNGKDDSILGCPVYQSTCMPALEGGGVALIFGNFKFYQIVDREDIRILRDPYTAKPYVKFYTTKRVGGDVIKKDAFKKLVCGE
ncbi:MAG: phage major capsid protein [Rickettsiales bacterium]|nr:MAG: phage major capsid protein [Rickettsiales bacterium]